MKYRLLINYALAVLFLAAAHPSAQAANSFPALHEEPSLSAAASGMRNPALMPVADTVRGDSCHQDSIATRMGWAMISYGAETAKYVFGLFIIILGALFVGAGWMSSLLEVFTC